MVPGQDQALTVPQALDQECVHLVPAWEDPVDREWAAPGLAGHAEDQICPTSRWIYCVSWNASLVCTTSTS